MAWQGNPQMGNAQYLPYSPPPNNPQDIELLHTPQRLSPKPSYSEVGSQKPSYSCSSESMPLNGAQNPVIEAQEYCKPTPWRPGFWRRFPWLGMGAWIVSFLCTVGAVMVLLVSNQKPVASWRLTPTVILAILSAAHNASLTFAFAQTSAISWWYSALKGGMIADLSRRWGYGTSVKEAILSGRNFNLMALATIFLSLTVVDGPLLQRASTVISQESTNSTSLKTFLTPLLPQGYTAIVKTTGDLGPQVPEYMTSSFGSIISEYRKNVPITSGIIGCVGNCSATVQAAGLSVSCADPTTANYDSVPDSVGSSGEGQDQTMFSITTTWDLVNCTTGTVGDVCDVGVADGGKEVIMLNISYAQTTNCVGSLVTTVCTLSSAVVEYPVLISGSTITLVNSTSASLTPVAVDPRTHSGNGNVVNSTLGGLYLASSDLFDSTVSWNFEVETEYTIVGLDIMAASYLIGDPSGDGCQYIWRDPKDDILRAYNEWMFRSAILAAGNDTTPYTLTRLDGKTDSFTVANEVDAQQTALQNVFVTHFPFLVAAAVVMICGSMAVLPGFFGFWKIGRVVSLNPIEVAKAFDAPILGGNKALSNAPLDVLVKSVGRRRFVYGEMVGGERKLVIETASEMGIER